MNVADRLDWHEGLDAERRRARQQVALNLKPYYGQVVTLVLVGGIEVSGLLRGSTLGGDPDPECSKDPITVHVRNTAPIALDRIVGVLPGD